MRYPEFRERLDAYVVAAEEKGPNGLTVVRALGLCASAARIVFDLSKTPQGTERQAISSPYVAIVSSAQPRISDRKYGVVLADSLSGTMGSDFFGVFPASARPSREHPSFTQITPTDPIYLRTISYLEGGSTLAVGGQPTWGPEACEVLGSELRKL